MSSDQDYGDEELRPPIKHLEKKFESLFVALQHESSDLICAIVASSYVDLALKTLLREHFVSGSTSDGLLKPTGSLGSIRAKGDLAYCLGFIPSSVKTALDKFGEIRNEFAHNLDVSFKDDKIAKMCDEMKSPAHQIHFEDEDGVAVTPMQFPYDDPRLKFVFIALQLAIIAVEAANRVRQCKKMDDADMHELRMIRLPDEP